MRIKILENGLCEFGNIKVTCLSAPKSNQKDVTVHFSVLDTSKYEYEPGYEKKYKRKLAQDKTYRYNNHKYDVAECFVF